MFNIRRRKTYLKGKKGKIKEKLRENKIGQLMIF